MAGSNRRFALVVALPFLFLAMAGWARAATVTVTNTLDSGAGSLRAQIAAASSGDTIDFSVTGTIALLSTLMITKNLTITGPTISPGIALDGQGAIGVMIVNSGVALTITNLTIENGNAFVGAGILANGTSTLTVNNCTFSGNSAGAGGGGGIVNNFILTVTNSTFSGNSTADGFGAGIENFSTLTVTNSTFSGNNALVGGGIANFFGSASLKGTILANEASGGNCSNNDGATLTDAGYNISDDSSCGFSGTSINNSTTLNLDPLGLQNNGGPTQTIALEPNSQALDFIPVASCTDQSSPTPLPLIADQRNFPRPDSGNLGFCDAGAFELQTDRITVVPGSEQTQIARPTTSSNSDQVNMAFTFIDHGSFGLRDGGAPVALRCDAGNDALNGINVDLFEGTCADLGTATGGLLLDLSPFVKHTISGHSYGTIFQSDPPDMLQQMNESVLARIVTQEPPWEETCGEWTIHIEVAGLDTAGIGLGGGNPFALVVEDGDKNEGCFDVTNAVVGGQLPLPTHKVRRGARRGRR